MRIFEWASNQSGFSRQDTTWRGQGVIGMGVVLLLFMIEQMFGAVAWRNVLMRLHEPVWRGLAEVERLGERTQQQYELVRLGGQRLAELEREVKQLRIDRQQLNQLRQENEQLRSVVEQQDQREDVVVRWYGSHESWFVNRGCRQGVRPGDTLLHDRGLLGVVEQTYPDYSSVTVWQDSTFRLAVRVGTSSARGVFQTASGVPTVEELPVRAAVREGSAVVTAGDAQIPPGIMVGSVVEVLNREAGLGGIAAVIEPFVRPEEVEWAVVSVQRREDACSDE